MSWQTENPSSIPAVAIGALRNTVRTLTPRNRKVAAAGDSFVHAEFLRQTTSTRRYMSSGGALVVAQALSGARFSLSPEAMLGVDGAKTLQILEQLVPAAIATGAGTLFLTGGTNDINAGDVALDDIVARKIASINQALAAGMVVIAEPIMPRNGWTNPNDAVRIVNDQKRDHVNRKLRLFADQHIGVHVTDADRRVIDGSSGANAPILAYLRDEVHFGNLGNFQRGQAIADIMNVILPLLRNDWVNARGGYHATNNPFGNLASYGNMAGSVAATGGDNTAGLTGVKPTDINYSRPSGTTLTAVGSKAAQANGASAFQIALGASGTGATQEFIRFAGTSINQSGNFAEGDVVAGTARVSIANLTGVQGIALSLAQNNGVSQVMDARGMATTEVSTDRLPSSSLDLVIPIAPQTITAYGGSGTQRLTPSLYVYADCSGSAPSGTVTWHSLDVYRVDAAQF